MLLVLALHVVIFSLLSIEQLSKREFDDELQINLSNSVVIPKSFVEKMVSPQSEERQSANSSKAPSIQSVTQALPNQASENIENTPVVKFNEEIIKPIQTIKPVKFEPILEKLLPVIEVQKPEEKAQPQSEVQIRQQVTVKTIELKQAEPKPSKVIAPTLPVLVEKNNKEKDAPEVSQPSRGTGSSVANSADSTKSSESSTSTSGGANSGTRAGGQSAPMSGNQYSAQTISSNNEMQAQLSGGKAQSTGSTSGTADADYKSESLRNAQPRYPIYARKMHQEGIVIVSAEVLTDGNAIDVRLVASSGIKLLDEAALETVKQWRFIPAKKDGIPYVQRLRIPVTFSLSK